MEKELKQYLEAGQIVNTHGLHGEVRVMPWANAPEFLIGIPRFFIDGRAYSVESCRGQKSCLLLKLAGVDDVDAASALRGKTIFLDRWDVSLDEHTFFIQDLIGLRALDQNGKDFGELREVIQLPKHDVYVIRGNDGGEYQIPAVKEFVKRIDMEERTIEVVLIEGMRNDAD